MNLLWILFHKFWFIKSLNLIKTQEYEGILSGIKGQYLIFDDDTVFNVRSNEGLVVALDILN